MKRIYRIAADTTLGVVFCDLQVPEKRQEDFDTNRTVMAKTAISKIHKIPVEEVAEILYVELTETKE